MPAHRRFAAKPLNVRNPSHTKPQPSPNYHFFNATQTHVRREFQRAPRLSPRTRAATQSFKI